MPKLNDVTPAGALNYKRAKDMVVGETLDGIYMGSFESTGQYKTPVHRIFTTDKVLIALNGCTSLDRYMRVIPVESWVHIEYQGQVAKDNGDNYFQFKVQRGDEDGEVSALRAAAKAAPPTLTPNVLDDLFSSDNEIAF